MPQGVVGNRELKLILRSLNVHLHEILPCKVSCLGTHCSVDSLVLLFVRNDEDSVLERGNVDGRNHVLVVLGLVVAQNGRQFVEKFEVAVDGVNEKFFRVENHSLPRVFPLVARVNHRFLSLGVNEGDRILQNVELFEVKDLEVLYRLKPVYEHVDMSGVGHREAKEVLLFVFIKVDCLQNV